MLPIQHSLFLGNLYNKPSGFPTSKTGPAIILMAPIHRCRGSSLNISCRFHHPESDLHPMLGFRSQRIINYIYKYIYILLNCVSLKPMVALYVLESSQSLLFDPLFNKTSRGSSRCVRRVSRYSTAFRPASNATSIRSAQSRTGSSAAFKAGPGPDCWRQVIDIFGTIHWKSMIFLR